VVLCRARARDSLRRSLVIEVVTSKGLEVQIRRGPAPIGFLRGFP